MHNRHVVCPLHFGRLFSRLLFYRYSNRSFTRAARIKPGARRGALGDQIESGACRVEARGCFREGLCYLVRGSRPCASIRTAR
jgi:hypothetical protein